MAKRRIDAANVELNMTPMIDVVFQLLIYFLVTMKVPDVSAHLDVFRPSAKNPPAESETPKMIQIEIFPGVVLMNKRSVTFDSMGDLLQRLGKLSQKQTVIITCARDSKHDQLIQVLDRCAKAGLSNLSVASMNE